MLTRALTPVAVILCGALLFAVPWGTTGCVDNGDGGSQGGSVTPTDAGEGGSVADSGSATLVYGCSDNGTQCDCYSPAPAEYTQVSCIAYSCCFSDTIPQSNGGVVHQCSCSNSSPCATTSTTATSVSACP